MTVKRDPDDSVTYDKYTGAQMDGKALPEGSHTATKGSLILTLKAAPAPTPTPKPVPRTGDGSNPALWLSLAVAGLILIAGTMILWNRKKRCGK